MATVDRWTRREVVALRGAIRLSLREFAAKLGVSQRTVSYWESGKTTPGADYQAVLDTQFAKASPAEQERFFTILSNPDGGRATSQDAADRDTASPISVPDFPTGESRVSWFSRPPQSEAMSLRVDTVDVEMAHEMVQSLRKLDNMFGGGRARSTVTSYLTAEIAPRLHNGDFRDSDRRAFYGVVAELNQLAGWIAYDVGDPASGRRHLKQAHDLCKEVQDDARCAEMLSGLSHQAAFLRSPDLAIDFAAAARTSASRSGLGLLRAESYVMEAHGHALLGDSGSVQKLLGEAERAFDKHETQEAPDWLLYFDRAYLSAKFAHCFRELGMSAEAERYARRSLEMNDGYDRGRLFNTALLASILAEQNRVEEACVLAMDALDMSGKVESHRSARYLKDLAARLQPFASNKVVADTIARYELFNLAADPLT